MELRRVIHFITVAEHGSLGRAAIHLGISQPALSKSLKVLEGELGARVFERGPHGSVLTREGEAFLTHARALAVEARNAELALQSLRHGKAGTLLVGTSPSLAPHVLPLAVARMLKVAPGWKVKVHTGMVDELLAQVRSGRLDLALTPLPARYADPELEHEPLGLDRLRVVCRVGHPLASRPQVSASDLARQAWVVPSGAASGRHELDRFLVASRQSLVQPVIESDSITFIRSLLPYTDLLSLLPLGLIEPGGPASDIVALTVDGPAIERSLFATRRRRTPVSPTARRFVDEVHATLNAMAGRHATQAATGVTSR